jgi:type VI secretion system (T6SS) baseplate-like injector VgrG
MDYNGTYRGVVTNNADPENLGRLKTQVPQVLGTVQTEWAWPASPNIAGIPPLAIGDPVWVAFEGGSLEHPIWLGTWTKVGQDLPPLPVVTAVEANAEALQLQILEQSILVWMTVAP